LKPAEFSPYRRSAAVESLEPLQPPLNSDATYAVVTASPESVYTRTDDDILDPEIRRVDGSIQPTNQPTILSLCYVCISCIFYRAMHYSAKHGIAIACRPSVRLSVRNVGDSGPHRLEILESNCTDT